MASDNLKTAVEIAVDVQGGGNIEQLAGSLDAIAHEAGEAAPAFKEMAGELRQLDALGSVAAKAAELRKETASLARQLDAAAADVDRLGRESEEAASNAARLAQAYGAEASAVKAARQSAAQLASSYNKAQEKARKLSAELGNGNRQLADARARLSAAGLSASTLAEQQRKLAERTREASSQAQGMVQAWQRLGPAAQKAAQQQITSHRQISAGVQSISQQLAGMQKIYSTLQAMPLAFSGMQGLTQMADGVQNLRARIKLAVGEAGDFQAAWGKVGDVAQRTSSSLQATGDLFARVAKAGQDAGKAGEQAIEEALQITTAVNQAAQLSGASAQASEAAITQLVQALQSGVLRGDEFNSVMEQAPRLAQALADGLGTTTGALRAMAQEGKLTADVVTEAIRSQAGVLEQEFEQLPQTVGRAMQNLTTQFQLFIGQLNESSGAGSISASVINTLADNLDVLARSAALAGASFGAWKFQGIIANAGSLAASLRAVAEQALASELAFKAMSAAVRGISFTLIATEAVRLLSVWREGSRQLEQAKQAMQRVDAEGELLALRFAKISEQTGVTVRSMQELDAAVKSGALVFDEASGKWLSAAQALAKVSEHAEGTRAALADVNAAQAVQQFVALQEAGEKTADALDKLRASMDVGDEASVAGMVRAFEALQTTGRASAEEVAAAWQRAMQSMDAKQVDMLTASLQLAEKQGQITAQQLEGAFKNLVGGALQDLGVNVAQALGGISRQAQGAIDGIDRVAQALQSTGADADTFKRAMEAAFAAAIPKADSLAAIKELEKRLLAAKDAGLVSERAFRSMSDALDGMKQALDPVNKLEAALKNLGVNMAKTWGGISSGARDAIKNVKDVRDIIAETGETGKKAGKTIKAAFLGAIKKMDSLDAIKAMREEIRAAGEAGKLTTGQINELTAAINQQEASLRQNTQDYGKMSVALSDVEQKTDEYASALLYLANAGGDVESAALEAADALSQMASSGESLKESAAAARDAADAAEEAGNKSEEAGRKSTIYWMSARAEMSKYREEASQWALDTVDALGTGTNRYLAGTTNYIRAFNNYFAKLRAATAEYAETMERLDAAQQRLASQQSGAAAGVEDLKLRLLELNGTEEQIAEARAAREKLQLEMEIKSLEIEKSRAAFLGDTSTVAQINEEIKLMKEQQALLAQIHREEARQRKEAAKEKERQEKEAEKEAKRKQREEKKKAAEEAAGDSAKGTGSSGGSTGTPSTSGPLKTSTINLGGVTINGAGISDPAKLAKLLEPELKKLQRLAA